MATAGLSEAVGSLTLSANSVIDFGNVVDVNTLNFANSGAFAANWTGTLDIYNWTDSIDRLFFGLDSSGLQASQLAQISFYSGTGSGFLGTGVILGTGEIVPVPEPTATLTALGLFGLAGYRESRRGRKRGK